MTRLWLALLACASLHAQTFFANSLLQDFLQLTTGQLNAIRRNNTDYNTWVSEKQSRISQVRFEIAQETARDTIDPNALGVRYAEIEGICRQLRDKATELRTTNLGVLTETQKAKLKVLEDAMKLAPVISEAQSVHLLEGNTAGVFTFDSIPAITPTNGFANFLLGTPAPSGCTTPGPSIVLRNGDFASRP